jgi:hypothetical protein
VDFEKRYGDLKPAFDQANVEKKELQATVDAYKQRYGELPAEGETPPQGNPWDFSNAGQQLADPSAQEAAPPPHVQGVIDAINYAGQTGDHARAIFLANKYGLVGHPQVALPTAPQGVQPEQVHQMVSTELRQYTENQRAIDAAIAGVATEYGQDFLTGEIEVNGVKTTRGHALRHAMETTGNRDAHYALSQIDGQGVRAVIRQQEYQRALQEIQQGAAAGQIPVGPQTSQQPPPSDQMNQDLERIGARTEPPSMADIGLQ